MCYGIESHDYTLISVLQQGDEFENKLFYGVSLVDRGRNHQVHFPYFFRWGRNDFTSLDFEKKFHTKKSLFRVVRCLLFFVPEFNTSRLSLFLRTTSRRRIWARVSHWVRYSFLDTGTLGQGPSDVRCDRGLLDGIDLTRLRRRLTSVLVKDRTLGYAQ